MVRDIEGWADADPYDIVAPKVKSVRIKNGLMGGVIGAGVGGMVALHMMSGVIGAGLGGIGTAVGGVASTGLYSPLVMGAGWLFGGVEIAKNVLSTAGTYIKTAPVVGAAAGFVIGTGIGAGPISELEIKSEMKEIKAKQAELKRQHKQEQMMARSERLQEAMLKSKAQARRLGLRDQSDEFIGHGLGVAGASQTGLAEGARA